MNYSNPETKIRDLLQSERDRLANMIQSKEMKAEYLPFRDDSGRLYKQEFSLN